MTEPTVSAEPPLYKCIIVKSIDTSKKVASAMGWCGLFAIVAMGCITIASATVFVIVEILKFFTPFLIQVPWYVYLTVFAIMTIPAYSTIWCLNHRAEKKNDNFDCQED